MKKYLFLVLIPFLFCSCNAESPYHQNTKIKEHDFFRDIPVFEQDSLVNIVVEIPAGCNQKWEVHKETGYLQWEEVRKDSLRVVKYLPYPANYGMIPRTFLPLEDGGDNDPLDVFLLGPALKRGTVVPGRIVGVLFMKDNEEQDDKLIAVQVDSWFYNVFSMDDLQKQFPGVVDILAHWLTNYKRSGNVELMGFGNETKAQKILHKAIQGFEKKHLRLSDR